MMLIELPLLEYNYWTFTVLVIPVSNSFFVFQDDWYFPFSSPMVLFTLINDQWSSCHFSRSGNNFYCPKTWSIHHLCFQDWTSSTGCDSGC